MDAKVSRIVGDALRQHFTDVTFAVLRLKFLEGIWDWDDDGYLEVNAVYEDGGAPEPHRLLGVERRLSFRDRLEPALEAVGVTAFPVIHYIAKTEWDERPDPE